MTRAPRLGKRRRRTTNVDELAAAEVELQPGVEVAAARPRGQSLLLDDVAATIRAPRRKAAKSDSLAAIAAELQSQGPTDTPLDELDAKLGAPRNRRRKGTKSDSLAVIAAELQSRSRADTLSLDEVATKLTTRTRRPRGRSLDEVAAAINAPSPETRVIEGGPLDFVLPARPVAIELVSGRGHYERVIGAIREAHTSVWIATANAKELMVEDPRARPGRRRSHRAGAYVSILALLDELAIKGVELRLLHAELPSGPFREELAQHPRLVAGGLALRRCPRVHMKAVIVDGELLYLGSANWTGAGLGAKGSGRRNFELGIVTGDAQLLDQVQALYERVWSGGECEGCKLHDECPGPLAELDRPSQLVQIAKPARRRSTLPTTSQLRRRRRPRLL